MPDAIDRIGLISDLLIENAESVTAQMKEVVLTLHEILIPTVDIDIEEMQSV